MTQQFDVVILGAGMGGSAVTWSLRNSGLSICVIDRGGPLPQEPANWDPDEVISNRRYDPDDTWYDENDRPFVPRVYYNLGGSSKFFGGTAFRYRERDFEKWPISYVDLAPFYDIAEKQMKVHGLAGSDPTEPLRGPYPYPPLENEEPIAWLAKRLESQGLQPFPLPIAVHQGDGGHCRKGSPCDGFPCKIRAKGDGENAFLRPALREDKSITVLAHHLVERLVPDEGGRRVVAAVGRIAGDGASSGGGRFEVRGGVFVLAAGAGNSAALLLRSSNERHPRGLANASDQVGRNFMSHNNTVLMALHPLRRNPTRFQKTLAFNDFYADGGNVQMRGKVLPQNLTRSPKWWIRKLAAPVAARSFDFWVMSEDLPEAENRITLRPDGSIRLSRSLNNLSVHESLVHRVKKALKKAGLPIILTRPPSPATIQHQIGTARMGDDPESSVVDRDCRTHEVENLYVADGSIFVSSAAVNPALTIAANALRLGSHLKETVLSSGG